MRALPLLMLLALLPATAAAQSAGAAAPAVVVVDAAAGLAATTIVRVPLPAAAGEARFEIVAEAGIRVFGALRGDAAPLPDGHALLPLTFAVPRSAPAGEQPAALVRVTWSGGEVETRVVARVAARRSWQLRLAGDHVGMAKGTTGTLAAEVTNAGNMPDTARLAVQLPPRWLLETPAAAVPLLPGETAEVVLRVRVPEDAAAGASHAVTVAVEGAAGTRTFATAHVTDHPGDGGGLVTLPGWIFVGASDVAGGMAGGGEPDVAVALAGTVLPDTDVAFTLRRSGTATPGTAMRRDLLGPQFRAEIRAPSAQLTAGDVYLAASPLTGGFLHGIGGSANAVLGGVRTELFAARPGTPGTGVQPGHLGRIRLSSALAGGTASLSVTDLERDDAAPAAGRTRSISGGFALTPARGHDVVLEAGLMRLADPDGRELAGLAAQAQYRVDAHPLNAELRARMVPGTLRGSSIGNEYFGSVGRRVTPALALSAWTFGSVLEREPGDALRFNSAALSARIASRPAIFTLTPTASRHRGGGGVLDGADQAGLAAAAYVPLGVLQLDLHGDVARVRAPAGRGTTTHTSARVGWHHPAGWLAFTASHRTPLLASSSTRLDLSGVRTFRRLEAEGGFGVDAIADGPRHWRGWLGVTGAVRDGTAIVAGVDYEPWRFDGQALHVSLGVRQRLTPPIPLRRQPHVHGTIFEDRNGNGVHDADEAGIAGVIVRRGHMQAVTDADGRYAFYGAAGEAGLEVDARSVATGLLVTGAKPVRARGRVDVPLTRTAALRLELFYDSTGDGVRQPHERRAAAALVRLASEKGVEIATETDAEGVARFGSLLPGRYTLIVSAAAGSASPVLMQLNLAPGEARTLVIPAPHRQREIRFFTAQPAGG